MTKEHTRVISRYNLKVIRITTYDIQGSLNYLSSLLGQIKQFYTVYLLLNFQTLINLGCITHCMTKKYPICI